MLGKSQMTSFAVQTRTISPAQEGDDELGPLKMLPGTWQSLPDQGWNMIALPFVAGPPNNSNYRLLLNRYNETLKFSLVDKAIPNRGIDGNGNAINADQFLAALDYEQTIEQIVAEDFPQSGKAGDPDLTIHHEPGLWLHMINEITNGVNIARLATIPHGDSVLALGSSSDIDGAPSIPQVNGLPIGVVQDLANPYLAPYKHFHENLFQGLFDPTNPNNLLKVANEGVKIIKTTILTVDTKVESGGIVNIPFIVKQANAASMISHFWIEQLADSDTNGNPKLRLQYSQVVLLDFFPRQDGTPGVISWPHISINTLEKVSV